MVSPESKRYYAQFMPTKSTVRYVHDSVDKMAYSIGIDFRWLCVLNCFSGKPVTGDIKNMIVFGSCYFFSNSIRPMAYHMTMSEDGKACFSSHSCPPKLISACDLSKRQVSR